MNAPSLFLDGLPVPFSAGQTIMEAATVAGIFIPHLCHHPEFKPQGSCKLCTVKANGRYVSACTMPAKDGMEVENNSPDLNDKRRTLLQMLFVEGNHFCPSCEKSGNCLLQALAYELEMLTPHFTQFYPDRPVDASHPDVLLDFNRCILCELCVRASRDVDRQERLRALRARHRQAPDRQCRIRSSGRHRFFARRQGGACLPGWRHSREAAGFPAADRLPTLRPPADRHAGRAPASNVGSNGQGS
jgi:NADH dehydrogenase/NADH:ubiquinone oxidoreductase subunit G